jgi:hypothetical protein
MSENSQRSLEIKEVKGEKVMIIQTFNNGQILINGKELQHAAEKMRKTWRPLSSFRYPTLDFKHDLTTNFPAHLVYHLDQVFHDRGYIRFTSLIEIGTFNAGDTPATVINLISQHAKYTGAIRSYVKALWTADNRLELQNKMNVELKRLDETWACKSAFYPDKKLISYEFEYDADGLRLSILPVSASTDVADYPNKVGNTSELFSLVSAHLNANIAVVNLDVATRSYSLTKLLLAFLDREFDFEAIRVNADDPEEWDYVSPSLDEELRQQAS